jgi:hypothetical protein
MLTLLLVSTVVWAESEGFTVSGEISFEKTGNIYVELVTKEAFENDDYDDDHNDREGEEDAPQESPFHLIIEIDQEKQKAKKVSFAFENVPEGTYVIQAFQDVNGNGEFDMGVFGPKEPWGMYYLPKRPRFSHPKFDKTKFEVNKDITDITFEVK